MRKYLQVLGKCPLFLEIEDTDLLKMLTCLGARIEKFGKRETVLSEGSLAEYIGIVLSGSVTVLRNDYYGTRSILSIGRESDVFAEAFACASAKLPVSVVANEPCEVMLINSSRIIPRCECGCDYHNRLIYNLMKDLATKTIMFHQRVEIISRRTTREKLLAYLMFYAKRVGSESFEIPFDRQELADYLEVDRSGLCAEISKLRGEGVLESNKRHFRLIN